MLSQASTTAFYHVLGNHCLRIPRDRLIPALRMPASYYSKQLPQKWRLIVLDTTEMSGHSGFSQVVWNGSSAFVRLHHADHQRLLHLITEPRFLMCCVQKDMDGSEQKYTGRGRRICTPKFLLLFNTKG